jgi:hypothetical protein
MLTSLQETPTQRYIGKTLTLTAEAETEVKSLSIAPGGNIVQHIEPDKSDPCIWDVANSKILNVQLIDSRTFRLVTGMDAPPTPITPDTYMQMGLPFYKLWREDSAKDSVAGKWSPVNGAMAVASANMKGSWKEVSKKSEPQKKDDYVSKSGPREEIDKGKGIDDSSESEREAFRERSFDFPIVLLDVDDTIPKFKSIAEHEEEGDWVDEEELYN